MVDRYQQFCNRLVNAGVSSWQIQNRQNEIRQWFDEGFSVQQIITKLSQTPAKAEEEFDQRFSGYEASNAKPRAQPLPKDFQPSPEVLEYLHDFQKVPMEFIAGQLIEFRLYWHETGEARLAWQSKFKSSVINQWKRSQREEGQRTHRTAVEELTDRSWADGIQLNSDSES